MTDRIITGLWQLAGGHDQKPDVESCSRVMEELVLKGLALTFDMADRESFFHTSFYATISKLTLLRRFVVVLVMQTTE